MSLEEVRDLFGTFNRSDRRPALFAKLQAFVNEVRSLDVPVSIYLNGSFVMSRVHEPADVDIAIILPALWDMSADLRPFEYNVLSRARVRRRFRSDLLVAVEGTEAAAEALAFFSQSMSSGSQALACLTERVKDW
jgi:hypothetical protein